MRILENQTDNAARTAPSGSVGLKGSTIHAKQQTAQKPFRVLTVTGVYPTDEVPDAGTFIKSQVDSLIAAGIEVEVLHPKSGPSPLRYAIATIQVFLKTLTGHFDVVHGHYGLWCMAARMQWTTRSEEHTSELQSPYD